jgi:ubiquitin carboxyl-terminal hydrolase 4/11/15
MALDSSVHEKSNPQKVVTKAAYLLFYRRRSDRPLGGIFLEKIVDNANRADESDEESQPGSRNASPFAAGEGRRLDDYSLNGSSSASRGVGAAHPGGLGTTGGAAAATNSEGELPAYSQDATNGDTRLFEDDNMMHDEGFGVQSAEMSGYPGLVGDAVWTWEGIKNKNQRNRANSPDSGSGDAVSNFSDRMADFEDEVEDETLGISPSLRSRNASNADLIAKDPHNLDDSIPMEVQTGNIRDDEDDPVAEIHVEKDEGLH